jgi:peptidoglycan-N-acetylglucosamine deacetylase
VRALAVTLLIATACAGSDPSTSEEDEPVEGETLDESDLRSVKVVYETQLRGHDLGPKQLHLTFDDGPGPRTIELATYLQREGIVATFFINGVNVPGREQALREIVARGHLLASHSQNHILLTEQTDAKVRSELLANDAIVRAYQPNKPVFFRPPYAGFNSHLVRLLTNLPKNEIGPIHWDIGSKLTPQSAADWACWSKKVSVQRCAELYEAETAKKGRGIVLLHDIHGKTIDMVKTLVPNLKAKGFTFVGLTKAPLISRAVEQGIPSFSTAQCFSGTRFAVVQNGACVESSHERQWRVCKNGEWEARSSETRCISTLPL